MTILSDVSFTQIVDGDAFEGKSAVAGYETANTLVKKGDDSTNPFMPKRPKHGTQGTAPEPKK